MLSPQSGPRSTADRCGRARPKAPAPLLRSGPPTPQAACSQLPVLVSPRAARGRPPCLRQVTPALGWTPPCGRSLRRTHTSPGGRGTGRWGLGDGGTGDGGRGRVEWPRVGLRRQLLTRSFVPPPSAVGTPQGAGRWGSAASPPDDSAVCSRFRGWRLLILPAPREEENRSSSPQVCILRGHVWTEPAPLRPWAAGRGGSTGPLGSGNALGSLTVSAGWLGMSYFFFNAK